MKMMHVFTRLMYSTHRVLGTLLCLVFLTWFLSAFVMLYERFPRISAKEQLAKQELLIQSGDSMPAIQTVLSRLAPDTPIEGMALNRTNGQSVFQFQSHYKPVSLGMYGAFTQPVIDAVYVMNVAKQWNPHAVSRIDTLYSLDQWVPWTELKAQLPLYKIYFADAQHTQLYIGSHTGEALQLTNVRSRFWAWLGAIPHWAYFSWLYTDKVLWERTMITLTALGCLMVLAGIWITVDVYRKTRRAKRQSFSPYKKKWYHWHYVSGIFFGLFVLTFTFSGMMSVMDVPKWIHQSSFKQNPTLLFKANAPSPGQYVLDYRNVIKAYPEAKRLEWANFRQHAYYVLTTDKKTYCVDASDTIVKELNLSKQEVLKGVEAVCASTPHRSMQIGELHHFETYYRDMARMLGGKSQLPVWKVSVDDADNSVFYIQPQTGSVRYVDTSSRIKYWCYTALHRMRIPGLNSNGVARKGLLWVLLLGGSVVSLSGVVLGYNYIRRRGRRLCRHRH